MDPILAETRDISCGLQLAVELCFHEVIVECDCKWVVDLLSAGCLLRNELGQLVQDCLTWVTWAVCLRSCKGQFTHLEENKMAHALPKIGLLHAEALVWIEDVPSSIASLVINDTMME